MHREDVTAALRKAGSSQARIARQLRVSKQAVSQAVSGRTRSPRIRKAISRAIGKPVADIWPAA